MKPDHSHQDERDSIGGALGFIVRLCVATVKIYWLIVSGFFKMVFTILVTVILAPVVLFSAIFLDGSIKFFGEERVFTALHWVGVAVVIVFAISLLGSISGGYQDNYDYSTFGFRR